MGAVQLYSLSQQLHPAPLTTTLPLDPDLCLCLPQYLRKFHTFLLSPLARPHHKRFFVSRYLTFNLSVVCLCHLICLGAGQLAWLYLVSLHIQDNDDPMAPGRRHPHRPSPTWNSASRPFHSAQFLIVTGAMHGAGTLQFPILSRKSLIRLGEVDVWARISSQCSICLLCRNRPRKSCCWNVKYFNDKRQILTTLQTVLFCNLTRLHYLWCWVVLYYLWTLVKFILKYFIRGRQIH